MAHRSPSLPFRSPYRHGFVRTAVAVPRVRLAEPAHNAAQSLALARRAAEAGAAVVLFPELGLSGYSLEDLFHQDALLDAVREQLAHLAEASRELAPVLLVGAPLRFGQHLFNCAVVLHRGRPLGVVPKLYLPNYREFYEKRQFTSGRVAEARDDGAHVELLGEPAVPFGPDLVFAASDLPDLRLHVEICEDLWTPVPPSTVAALGGATVLANLSASNITIGKAEYRHSLCSSQSARCLAAYLYAAAGAGESTTDLAWDGHALIYENGTLLAESERFSPDDPLLLADVDLDRLVQERMRMTSFHDSVERWGHEVAGLRPVDFELGVPDGERELLRPVPRFPYVPADAGRRDERCAEAYEIQVAGLVQRLQATGIERPVIGVSGGLDSTQALLVACRAMDRLELPRSRVLAVTMPGFATSERTLASAHRLMDALGVSSREIDIRPSCRQMLEDIDHPFARGEAVYDVTFENVQAGERTSHLFRLANHVSGLVVGTGDLSELALGWTTYGVGDQMSHYNVNTSVPKTLIQHLVRWVAERPETSDDARSVLLEILATEISPELVPVTDGENGEGEDGEGESGEGDNGAGDPGPTQSTEAVVGPYELQDFHLYHLSRFGYRPSKVAYLAHEAWGDVERGAWPAGHPESERRAYDLATIKRWLAVFLERFFGRSQFKRSASPNGPKVGSGGSLSPRGDWRAPSDSSARAWLDELERNVPDGLEETDADG